MINSITIDGNMTNDPVFKTTENGTKLANFTIANNRKYKTAAGEEKEEVCFIECEAWGWIADMVNERGTKGKHVLVSGRLKQRTWETDDGQKKSKHSISADSVLFIEKHQKKNDISDII